EDVERFVRKGDRVYAEGRLEYRSWQDASGRTRYATEIVAQELIPLGGSAERSPARGADRATGMEPESDLSGRGRSSSWADAGSGERPIAEEDDLPFCRREPGHESPAAAHDPAGAGGRSSEPAGGAGADGGRATGAADARRASWRHALGPRPPVPEQPVPVAQDLRGESLADPGSALDLSGSAVRDSAGRGGCGRGEGGGSGAGGPGAGGGGGGGAGGRPAARADALLSGRAA